MHSLSLPNCHPDTKQQRCNLIPIPSVCQTGAARLSTSLEHDCLQNGDGESVFFGSRCYAHTNQHFEKLISNREVLYWTPFGAPGSMSRSVHVIEAKQAMHHQLVSIFQAYGSTRPDNKSERICRKHVCGTMLYLSWNVMNCLTAACCISSGSEQST